VFNIWNNSTGGTWQNVVAGGELYQGPAGPTPALNTLYEWISVDGDGDGIPGIQFVDGPFINFRANFNFKTTLGGGGTVIIPESTVPGPSIGGGCAVSTASIKPGSRSDWLLVAGFVAWMGIGLLWRRRRQSARL
jgi:MYXO-CTERM domain-containing protein